MVPNTKLSHYVIFVSFLAYWTNEVLTTDLNDSTRHPIIGQLFNDNESPNISTQEILSSKNSSQEISAPGLLLLFFLLLNIAHSFDIHYRQESGIICFNL